MAHTSVELMGTPDELFHWIPGEMVVVVRLHRKPAEDTQDILIEQIRSQLNSLLVQYNMALEPYGSYGRWSDAPAMPPIRRRAFVFGLHRQIRYYRRQMWQRLHSRVAHTQHWQKAMAHSDC